MSDSQQYDTGLYANHNYEPVSRSTANMTDMNRAHGIVASLPILQQLHVHKHLLNLATTS